LFLFLPEILIAIQPRPVDLPLKSPFEDKRKNNNESQELKIEGIEKNEEENIKIDAEGIIDIEDLKWLPRIVGEDIPYSKNELKEILKEFHYRGRLIRKGQDLISELQKEVLK